jgi:hypothetical protein
MGYVAVGWQWLVMERVARERLASGDPRRPFLEAKLKTAHVYFARILPGTTGLLGAIQAGAASLMALTNEEF